MEINLSHNVFEANECLAKGLRATFKEKGVFAINLMASPGAGKTSFILKTIDALKGELQVAVIEGDIASSVDAEKVKEAGAPAVQINTGGACHLDSKMIGGALSHLNLDEIDILIIENVGNLVCPAEFDLGEDIKVVISSIAEGDDKPLKYPRIFSEANALIINKMDLAVLSDFNLSAFRSTVSKLNPAASLFEISCKTGDGFEDWTGWLKAAAEDART